MSCEQVVRLVSTGKAKTSLLRKISFNTNRTFLIDRFGSKICISVVRRKALNFEAPYHCSVGPETHPSEAGSKYFSVSQNESAETEVKRRRGWGSL